VPAPFTLGEKLDYFNERKPLLLIKPIKTSEQIELDAFCEKLFDKYL
jgi:hypothetical protein